MTDLGLTTTPQGHFAVYAAYRGCPNAETDYYDRLARGYATLCDFDSTTSENDTNDTNDTIFVDCANGVGAQKLARLLDAVQSANAPLSLSLRNVSSTYTNGSGSLNKDVGADYVQKERRVPKHGGFSELPSYSKCVSIDGDADRLVYFYDDAT